MITSYNFTNHKSAIRTFKTNGFTLQHEGYIGNSVKGVTRKTRARRKDEQWGIVSTDEHTTAVRLDTPKSAVKEKAARRKRCQKCKELFAPKTLVNNTCVTCRGVV